MKTDTVYTLTLLVILVVSLSATGYLFGHRLNADYVNERITEEQMGFIRRELIPLFTIWGEVMIGAVALSLIIVSRADVVEKKEM